MALLKKLAVITLISFGRIASSAPLAPLLGIALAADEGAAICGPAVAICEAGTLAFTAVAFLTELFSSSAGSSGPPKPPPGEPDQPQCDFSPNTGVDMGPDPDKPDSGPCKLKCVGCKFTAGTSSNVDAVGVFKYGLKIDKWHFSGGIQLYCSGKGSGSASLVMINEKASMPTGGEKDGGEGEECPMNDPQFSQEVGFDVTMKTEYSVSGEGYLEMDVDWTVSQGPYISDGVYMSYWGDFNIVDVSGALKGEYDIATSISATIKDLLIQDPEKVLGGLGITARGTVEAKGAGDVFDSEDPAGIAVQHNSPYTLPGALDWTNCMSPPNVTGKGEVDMVIYTGDKGTFSPVWVSDKWRGISQGSMVCAYYDADKE